MRVPPIAQAGTAQAMAPAQAPPLAQANTAQATAPARSPPTAQADPHQASQATNALDPWYTVHFVPMDQAQLRTIPQALVQQLTALSNQGILEQEAASAIMDHIPLGPQQVCPENLRVWLLCALGMASTHLPAHRLRLSPAKYDLLIVLKALCASMTLAGELHSPPPGPTWLTALSNILYRTQDATGCTVRLDPAYSGQGSSVASTPELPSERALPRQSALWHNPAGSPSNPLDPVQVAPAMPRLQPRGALQPLDALHPHSAVAATHRPPVPAELKLVAEPPPGAPQPPSALQPPEPQQPPAALQQLGALQPLDALHPHSAATATHRPPVPAALKLVAEPPPHALQPLATQQPPHALQPPNALRPPDALHAHGAAAKTRCPLVPTALVPPAEPPPGAPRSPGAPQPPAVRQPPAALQPPGALHTHSAAPAARRSPSPAEVMLVAEPPPGVPHPPGAPGFRHPMPWAIGVLLVADPMLLPEPPPEYVGARYVGCFTTQIAPPRLRA